MNTKPLTLLATMMAGLILYSLLAGQLYPLFGLTDENDQYLLSKWLLVALLLGIVILRGEVRASGQSSGLSVGTGRRQPLLPVIVP